MSGWVAQLVERGTHKPEVVGSIPTPATNKLSCNATLTRGREMASRKAHNLEIGGSNPPPATKGPWCSPVNTSPCHGEDRRFESGRTRHKEHLLIKEVFFVAQKNKHLNYYNS